MCEKIFQLTATSPAPLSLLARWFSGSFPSRPRWLDAVARSVDKNLRGREGERERKRERERPGSPVLLDRTRDSVSTAPLKIKLGQPCTFSPASLKFENYGRLGVRKSDFMICCMYVERRGNQRQPAMGLWDEARSAKLPPSWLPRPVQVSPPFLSVGPWTPVAVGQPPRLPNCHRRDGRGGRPVSVRPSVRHSSVVGVIGPLRRGYSEPTTNIFQGEGDPHC